MIDPTELYPRHARQFDAVRARNLMERQYLELAIRLCPPPGRVLDVGCGSGEPLARYFIEQGYLVTGVDAADEMLEMCRERFPEMSWQRADMRSMELDERFDIVIAWDSFFHLKTAEQRDMFARFRRNTAPGGVLIFTSGVSEGEAIGDLFGDALYHASLDTEEYRRLLNEQGYDVVLHRIEDPACGGHTVWVARLGIGTV